MSITEKSTPAESIQTRIRQLLEKEPRYGRYSDLEQRTGVKADTWKAVVLGRQRPTVEVLGALLTEWPQLATWILMGNPNGRQFSLVDLAQQELRYGVVTYADRTVQIVVDVGSNGAVDVYARAGKANDAHWTPTEMLYMQTAVRNGEAQIEVLTGTSAPTMFVAINSWIGLLKDRTRTSTTITFFQRFQESAEREKVAEVVSKFHLEMPDDGESDKVTLGVLSDAQLDVSLLPLRCQPGMNFYQYNKSFDELFVGEH